MDSLVHVETNKTEEKTFFYVTYWKPAIANFCYLCLTKTSDILDLWLLTMETIVLNTEAQAYMDICKETKPKTQVLRSVWNLSPVSYLWLQDDLILLWTRAMRRSNLLCCGQFCFAEGSYGDYNRSYVSKYSKTILTKMCGLFEWFWILVIMMVNDHWSWR